MNDEKLEQILRSIGVQHVPDEVARLAEHTAESFTAALRFIHAQQLVRTPFIVGLKRIAAAAVIVIVFSIGLGVGRFSKSPAEKTPSLDVPAYTTALLPTPGRKPENGFWQQKAIAALKPRPYVSRAATKTDLINAYKQYLKEKHYD